MAKKSNWNDDYWLYVMQLYMSKPTGVKPLYSKAAADRGYKHSEDRKDMGRVCRQPEKTLTCRKAAAGNEGLWQCR